MTFKTMKEAVPYIYTSLLKAKPFQSEENDALTRAPHLTKELLSCLDLIPSSEKVILVTGSKGKGSTSRMMAAILRKMGLKVGLFTSPHLIDYNERIRVNGKAISDDAFLTYLNQHTPTIDRITASIENLQHYLGPTGILLSIALAHFQSEETDINVIEIGRGGTYDDTNVLENKWAVVSKVMEEHLGFLGHSLEDIVRHKVGIAKESTEYAVIGKQSEDALVMMEDMVGKSAVFYGEDYSPSLTSTSLSGSTFTLRTMFARYDDLLLPLLGSFQVENAALAIQACETVMGRGLPGDLLKEALRELKWPGRLEVVAENPTVVLDGSINRVSAAYLKEILPLVDSKKVATIIAVPSNKDYEGVIKVCSEFSDVLVVTKPDNSHKMFPDDALAVAKKYHSGAVEVGLLSEAVEQVRTLEPTLIFIVGTQSMIGSAKEIWKDSLMDIG
ncbi:bifunctional folylpolyglutamate synthase/dihydrofolate synthase [Sutcliffiella horikoshii]|uniref:bifunctional folylpolyglutamate synthase/dihydrofolate synthase n=1 Tax=Sutcliffiella horikoshii TaxID=79883 RepID=UPI001CFE4D24|nr:Mur ligase family protein [Sutcliffiella horikoshii]